MGVPKLGQIFAVLFSASYGLSNVFTAKALSNATIDKFTGQYITLLVNSVINLIVLLIYFLFFTTETIEPVGILYFAIAGFFNSFLSRGIFYASIPYIGVSRAGILKITSPLFAITGGILILGEKLSKYGYIGAALVISGIFLLSIETMRAQRIGILGKDKEKVSSIGVALGILSGFILGVGNIFRKLGINSIPSSIIGASIGSFAALVAIIIYKILVGKKEDLINSTKLINKDYLISGILSSLALYCVFISLKYIPVSQTNSIGASESLFTMLWSTILLKKRELINARIIIISLIVISGISILLLV